MTTALCLNFFKRDKIAIFEHITVAFKGLCVCVCVCVREREREIEIGSNTLFSQLLWKTINRKIGIGLAFPKVTKDCVLI